MLDRVRAACLALPETSERLSHGAPGVLHPGKAVDSSPVWTITTVTAGSRSGVPLAPDIQSLLTDASPEVYFVPPYYVGHRGWLGVRLDRGLAWKEIAGLIEDAYLTGGTGEARSGGPRAQCGGVSALGRIRASLRRRLATARETYNTGGVGAVVLKGLLLLGYHRVILYEVVLNPVPPPNGARSRRLRVHHPR